MAENKIVGYKKVFGFVLPDWVDEKQINASIGYVLVAVVMLFVLLLVINPSKDRIAANNKAYKTETDKLNTLQGSKKSLDDLSNNIDPNEQNAIFQSMPINYSPEEAVFELRNIAASTGVSITQYSLPAGVVLDESQKQQFSGSTSVKNEASVKFQSFPVTISVSGDINSILKFTDKIEKSLPMGFVSDLGIQEATKLSNTSKSEANLKLQVTYYQPIIVSFNLGNLQQLTQTDLSLIKELGTYAQTSFQPGSSFATSSASTTTTGGSQNLFGI